MNTYKVAFLQENIEIQAEEGATLLEVQRMAGVSPDAPCGGRGKCGKCLVNIRRDAGQPWRRVQACRTQVCCDLQVQAISREASHKILLSGMGREVSVDPALKVREITVMPCAPGESTSDWNRLCRALKEAGGSGSYEPKLSLLPKIGAFVKEREGKARAVVSGNQILDLRREGEGSVLMAAFDIGTTSVAGYLLDGETGAQLGAASTLNPQTQYGADVIMRADYALEHGPRELEISVRVLVKKMLAALCREAGRDPEDIYQVCLVGNTCMHHLFLGISPDSLVHAPYNPAVSEALLLPASDYRLGVNPGAQLLMLPVIAGFVGADTVGCLLAVNLEEEEKMTLLVDIGTNGEIVLGNKKRRIACSAAAGPAFEGAKIQCGMRGAAGAVEHVSMEDGKLKLSVIGGGKAAGICGSGLIDLIARLLEAGIIDESGRLFESPGTIYIEGKPAYLLAGAEESLTGEPIFLSQKDIREVQLAKGAIAAGIRLLADWLGVSLEEVEQVYIAGAFGNYMDPQSACRIGLIPPRLKDCIIPIGNAAGEGAKLALLNQEELMRAKRLAGTTEFLELASLPEFQDQFVEELEFPREGTQSTAGGRDSVHGA